MNRLLPSADYYFRMCIIMYLPVVFLLKKIVDELLTKNTKKYLCDLLEMPWAAWCLSLSIFSAFGTYHTSNYLFFDYQKIPVMDTSAGLWVELFILSKIPELIDTIFIVLRSKPLVALQWYHHFTTLLISYLVSDLYCDEFIPFIFMNYLVHVFMYLYFALYCFFGKRLNIYGTFVNVIQTMQMFFAIGYAFYVYIFGNLHCEVEMSPSRRIRNFFLGFFMYITFFGMFISLYFERTQRIKKQD